LKVLGTGYGRGEVAHKETAVEDCHTANSEREQRARGEVSRTEHWMTFRTAHTTLFSNYAHAIVLRAVGNIAIS
jgi:hypothetical protein